ncbi:helix-turn-helix domain-containing protein [Mycobacterium avium subsp. hominissuis]|uniref:helix-turn-helix domain-containing protein n=1 Tax=Mycobacterium avium TaxID=1764 RepID=UPI001EE08D54|nr:helix-turn-helix domain-containing protein [Mycobacterium avium]
MSFSKLTWLKRTDGHKFTGTEFRVLVALYNHTDAQGRNAFPGLDLLVEETGYRKSGISEAISSLKARGWIRETRKGSGLSGKASSFDLVPDAPKPPNSSAVAETLETGNSSGLPETLTPIVPAERTNSSAVAETLETGNSSGLPETLTPIVPAERTNSSAVAEPIVPPERNPSDPLSDPDNRSGSRSDHKARLLSG